MIRLARKIVLYLVVLPISIVFLIIASRLAYNFLSGNIHSVIPGKIYRTAQLGEKGLTKYTNQLHLKTIINLRGKWTQDKWYQVESLFAKTHHLNYYPIQFSAYQLPTKKRLRELVHLLQTVPKPLAFHCEGGADRTGMAAAISVILFEKNPTINDIKRQVTWRYNAISDRTVGYQLLRNYFAWLKENHYHSSKQRFLQWVNSPAKMKPYHGWFVV